MNESNATYYSRTKQLDIHKNTSNQKINFDDCTHVDPYIKSKILITKHQRVYAANKKLLGH